MAKRLSSTQKSCLEELFCKRCMAFGHSGKNPDVCSQRKRFRPKPVKLDSSFFLRTFPFNFVEETKSEDPVEYISVAALNIHMFERGSDTSRLASLIRDATVDIIGLEEVVVPPQRLRDDEDLRTTALGNLASSLNMYCVYVPASHGFGNAILSKWPILASCGVQLKMGGREVRACVLAAVQTPLGVFRFICTHLDHIDEPCRCFQAAALTSALDTLAENQKELSSALEVDVAPLIGNHVLAGDLNCLDLSDYNEQQLAHIALVRSRGAWEAPHGECLEMLKKDMGYIDCRSNVTPDEPLPDDVVPGCIQRQMKQSLATCRFHTRIDYLLMNVQKAFASTDFAWTLVKNSYSVVFGDGVTDHHLIKAELKPAEEEEEEKAVE